MAAAATKIIADALELPPEERAEVIEELVRSLDHGDDLDDDDRELLHEALRKSDDESAAGAAIPADDVLDRLRKR